MVTMEEITAAVNARCKTAMRLAGYENPRCGSLNTEGAKRPECITNISSRAAVEAGGMFTRYIDVFVLFAPENEDAPYEELKRMSDCLTRAFLNPITVDGYRKLPNDQGINIVTDIDHDVLDMELTYEFDVAEEEVLLDEAFAVPEMEELRDKYREG